MAVATKRERTPAQRANDERLKGHRPGTAVQRVANEGEVLESEDSVLAFLTDVSDRYKASKGKRSQQAALVKEALGIINKLDAHAYPELFADEGFQNLIEAFSERQTVPGQETLPPGSTIRKGPFVEDLKAWRWDDIKEDGGIYIEAYKGPMPWVDYTPRGLPAPGRQYVCWQGLEFIFVNDETVHVPKCFVDVLEESFRAQRRAEAHAEFLFKQKNSVPHTDLLDPATIRVRGMMTGGGFNKTGAGTQWDADPYCKELEARLAGEEVPETEEAVA